MLGKLMKYDMRYMARVLPWIYAGGLLISALLCGVIFLIDNELVLLFGVNFASFLFIVAVEAVSICSTVFMIVRIYRNMYSDEGYLTFTLPVKTSEIVNSKIITGAIWTLISYVVAALMVTGPVLTMIYKVPQIFGGEGVTPLQVLDYIITFFVEIIRANSVRVITVIALVALLAIVTLFYGPALYTFCASATHKAKKARVFASIGMFAGISYGVGVVISVISTIVNIFGFSDIDTYMQGGVSFSSHTDSILPPVGGIEEFASSLFSRQLDLAILMLLTVLLIYVAVTVFSWIMALRITDKKLNLN